MISEQFRTLAMLLSVSGLSIVSAFPRNLTIGTPVLGAPRMTLLFGEQTSDQVHLTWSVVVFCIAITMLLLCALMLWAPIHTFSLSQQEGERQEHYLRDIWLAWMLHWEKRVSPPILSSLKSKSIRIQLDWHTTQLLNESPIYRYICDGPFYIFPLQTHKLHGKLTFTWLLHFLARILAGV